jgi:hypothetical protein
MFESVLQSRYSSKVFYVNFLEWEASYFSLFFIRSNIHWGHLTDEHKDHSFFDRIYNLRDRDTRKLYPFTVLPKAPRGKSNVVVTPSTSTQIIDLGLQFRA